MARELVSVFSLSDVQLSKVATGVIEKRFTALNGYDAALRKGSILLVLSDSMKEEDKTRGDVKFKSQFFWAIDVERNKLVKVSRTGLAGGMGYEQLPNPGMWSLNAEGTWHILKPLEDDPAVKTRKSWGIGKLLPGAFEYEKKQVSVPRCFVIEVTDVEYLYSRNPIDAAASTGIKQKELSDLTFKPDSARMWDGKAYYPERAYVDEVVAKYNSVHDAVFTDDMKASLLR